MIDIQFILGVAGMALIITKSDLLKPFRMFCSSMHLAKENSNFWWFFSSITNCAMCFSIWGGAFLYVCKLIIPDLYESVSWIFGASIVTTLIMDIRQWICKQ